MLGMYAELSQPGHMLSCPHRLYTLWQQVLYQSRTEVQKANLSTVASSVVFQIHLSITLI